MITPFVLRRASCNVYGGILTRRSVAQKPFHSSTSPRAISPLRMPALSPTMESGQISKWNLDPGTAFSAGDILLTVETDKAEVDVEAQDDGYMGQHLVPARTAVKVGEVIAVLGEEAEDVNKSVEVPEAWKSTGDSSGSIKTEDSQNKIKSTGTSDGACASSSSDNKKSAAEFGNLHPTAKMPLSPAVSRLLIENQISDATEIKGTGLNGRLTKGDVLLHLGKVSSPVGSAQNMIDDDARSRALEKSSLSSATSTSDLKPQPPIDGPTLRRLITEGLALVSQSTETPIPSKPSASFSSILGDYHSMIPLSTPTSSIPPPPTRDTYLDGLSS
ncbi:uncharacterized protein MELLADRAFT_117566 [Melampsora larici-populina 98AG31]|uniref:Uncharacterized protein n=1 Tax=Melampsora larici-populina (strain 98AG31 / pathotype 3-4-7) TaxID=747676 RepID=F4RYW1_MELLP|nr:uncharacterized protein MELLADRAFT_117566 [Melampsora larici-populina 98AG31]EGG02317.1 hypothetical protein MELLADRAFT_117566 [Melampsora larici-populina 98AG31]